MANKRTILASTWAFAPDAAQELSTIMQNVDPEHIKCTYHGHDNTFVVEGDNVDKFLKDITDQKTDFIQQEVNKDSLDVPRVWRAEIPEVADSAQDEIVETRDSGISHEEDLLDFESDDETKSQKLTEKWTSNGGGIGYFTKAPPSFLKELGSLTGTDITSDSNDTYFLISGKYPDDLKEAMNRLTRLDQSLSLSDRPILGHVLEIPGIDAPQFQLANYRYRTYPASRRILGVVETTTLAQMLVTTPILTDAQKNSLGKETGQTIKGAYKSANKFRHWIDFRYPEFGDGKKYLDLQPAIPNKEKNADLTAVNDAPSAALAEEHPHLTPEMASRVDRWVAQSSSPEKETGQLDVPVPDAGPRPQSQSQPQPRLEALVSELKQVKGVKKRVPIKLAQHPPVEPVATKQTASIVMKPSKDAPVTAEPRKQSGVAGLRAGLDDGASTDVLLDLSSPTVTATPAFPMPSFYQAPLIPVVPSSVPDIYEDEPLLDAPVPPSRVPAPNVVSSLKTILSKIVLEDEDKKTCAVRETLKQCENEESPGLHRTMMQKASPGSETSKYLGGERQLRLEEMWHIRPKMKARPAPKRHDKANDDEQMKKLFSSLKPALEAAQSFPGALALKMQIGTILLPPGGRNSDAGIMSVDHWNTFFRPRNNTFVPGSRFVDRSTASGSDADSILDLCVTDDSRMFEDEVSDGGIVYEFNCRTKGGRTLLVAIDESGDVQVKERDSILGAVSIHFPFKVWDASISLQGTLAYLWGFDKGLDEAIQSFMQSVWVQPRRALLRMFCTVPEGDLISIEKVLMKRWTRHKHIRSHSPVMNSTNASDLNNMQSDLFLQITEVQDLVTGIHPADTSVLRARSENREEMAQKGRLWFETSIVSSSIEDILRSNSTLELGEKTEDWEAIDLLGEAVGLVGANYTSNPVAEVIGNSGIRDMYRLAKFIVERIDHVGHPEEKRLAVVEQQDWNSFGAAGGRVDSSRSAGGAGFAPPARVNPMISYHARDVGSKPEEVKSAMEKDAASMMTVAVRTTKVSGEFW